MVERKDWLGLSRMLVLILLVISWCSGIYFRYWSTISFQNCCTKFAYYLQRLFLVWHWALSEIKYSFYHFTNTFTVPSRDHVMHAVKSHNHENFWSVKWYLSFNYSFRIIRSYCTGKSWFSPWTHRLPRSNKNKSVKCWHSIKLSFKCKQLMPRFQLLTFMCRMYEWISIIHVCIPQFPSFTEVTDYEAD